MSVVRDDSGMTLVELLVAMLILGLISTAFYQVLFAGSRGSQTASNVAHVSQEARSGLNRMIRDTREADAILSATPNAYRIQVDYNNDGVLQSPNSDGDYEDETFSFTGNAIFLNGELLIDGVSQSGTRPVFQYSSNKLEYDWSGDGVTTLAELEEAPSHGITTLGDTMSLLSDVSFAFRLQEGNSAMTFMSKATLRNSP